MIRRNWNHAVKLLAGAALIAALAAGLLIAQGSEDDDRPPIIVHNGSLIFDGGEGTNVRPWSKDAFLGEWKPDHDEAKGVRTLEVKFEAVPAPAPACAAATLSGREVLIEYRVNPNGNPLTEMRVHLRRKHLLGKKEPKVDSNGAPLNPVQATIGSPPVSIPTLVYPDSPSASGGSAAPGWISKVTVDGTACAFAQPPNEAARLAFKVRIQPKKQN
jgi:hypothetical protein